MCAGKGSILPKDSNIEELFASPPKIEKVDVLAAKLSS
jgi:hypothetical protein